MFLSKGADFIFLREVILHLQREAISTTKENNSCCHNKGDNFIERMPYFQKQFTQQDLMHDPNMHTDTGLQELKTVSESISGQSYFSRFVFNFLELYRFPV